MTYSSSSRCLLRATYRFIVAVMTSQMFSPRISAMRSAISHNSAEELSDLTCPRIRGARRFSPKCFSRSRQSSRGMRTRAMNVSPVFGRATRRTLRLPAAAGHSIATVIPVIVATETLAVNPLTAVMCGNRNVRVSDSIHHRQLAGQTVMDDSNDRNGPAVSSSIAVSPTDVASDLDEPTCDRHWRAATFTVTWETAGDHERREPVCDRCLPDVLRDALTASAFCPPVVSPVDRDTYLVSEVAA